MKAIGSLLISIVLLTLCVGCDPFIDVEYNIVNITDDSVDVRIYGLRDVDWSSKEVTDTTIAPGEKMKLYMLSTLGSNYFEPADTIMIFDSVRVVKKGTPSKTNFRYFKNWHYTQEEYKYGGGAYHYEMVVRAQDF